MATAYVDAQTNRALWRGVFILDPTSLQPNSETYPVYVNVVNTLDTQAVKSTTTTHDAVNLTADDTNYNSDEIDCSTHKKFLLMYDITENGTLVNNDRLRIRVQFREANGTWRDYANGPFGALYEEESTTPCNFAVSGDCIGERMRVVVTTDYTNADPTTNYFTITTKITLMR